MMPGRFPFATWVAGSLLKRPDCGRFPYRILMPEIAREMTSRWISAVPSKMS